MLAAALFAFGIEFPSTIFTRPIEDAPTATMPMKYTSSTILLTIFLLRIIDIDVMLGM
jgi:hypothetical protein